MATANGKDETAETAKTASLYGTVARMLKHKNGATVDEMASAAGVDGPKVRWAIDRLRRRQIVITCIGPARFKAGGEGARPRGSAANAEIRAAMADLSAFYKDK